MIKIVCPSKGRYNQVITKKPAQPAEVKTETPKPADKKTETTSRKDQKKQPLKYHQ
jgi:hypothetical protein